MKMNNIAIVGASIKLAGGINSIDDFWDLLINNQRISEKSIRNHSCFDASFFNILKKNVTFIDPQRRQLMQSIWHCIEDGGFANQLEQQNIGLICNIETSQHVVNTLYNKNILNNQSREFKYLALPEYTSSHIGYLLNLKGPCLNINTACSSSLVSTTLGIDQLQNNNCDAIVVASSFINNSQNNENIYGSILSQQNTCSPFDEKADGTVFADGIASVMLMRLEDAIKHNKKVYAVINSYGINNDGNNKAGYTAPSIIGQSECIKKAIDRSPYKIDDIEYIEAHGTGTILGDQIELKALDSIYKQSVLAVLSQIFIILTFFLESVCSRYNYPAIA